MRLSYALLVAATAAAVISSGNAAPTVDGRSTELSAMSSTNIAASIDTNIGDGKRSLRYHNNKDLEGDNDMKGLVDRDVDEEDADKEDTNEEDADEEERKYTNMFSTSKLDEMLDGTKVMSRFKKWKKKGYNTYNLPEAVQASKYDELRKLYRKFLYYN